MIRGNKRPVPAKADKSLQLDLRASIHNRFDVEVLDAATGELKQRARGFNVICDALWDKLLASSSGWWTPKNYFYYVLYGSGSGTPDASDTTLFNKIAAIMVGTGTSNYRAVEITVDRANSVAYGRAVVTIQAEEAVGETITEVGIGYDATHVVTHALLEDMNGNPISIAKTNADVVKIYATVYLHWPAAAFYGGSINLSEPETDDNFTLYRVMFGRQNYAPDGGRTAFALCSPKKAIRVASSPGDRVSTTTVNRSTKKITAAYRFPATADNLPIRYMGVQLLAGASLPSDYGTAGYAMTAMVGSWFTPPAISGEAVGTGDGTTKDFKTAFPVKSGATVKVNGSAASGVTVRTGAPDGGALYDWLNPVLGKNAGGSALYPFEWTAPYYDCVICGFWNNAGGSVVFENPFYSAGVGEFSFNTSLYSSGQVSVKASDDLATWTDVGTVSLTNPSSWDAISVSPALQNKRFYKVIYTSSAESSTYVRMRASVPGTAPETNVHFETAPAAGAVITIDYTPDCIAKDENHVFDFTLELTLGEYSE